MTYDEIKHTHQELSELQENTDKLLNSGSIYMNKITLKIFLILIIILLNFWLHWVFVAAHGLSLVVVSRHYSSLWTAGFSMHGLLLFWRTGSRCPGFRGCSRPCHICSLWVLELRLSNC